MENRLGKFPHLPDSFMDTLISQQIHVIFGNSSLIQKGQGSTIRHEAMDPRLQISMSKYQIISICKNNLQRDKEILNVSTADDE